MLLAVSVTAVLKLLIKASISVSWFSWASSGANFPPIFCWKNFCDVGVLELQIETERKTNLNNYGTIYRLHIYTALI